jgi:hypothetical protein
LCALACALALFIRSRYLALCIGGAVALHVDIVINVRPSMGDRLLALHGVERSHAGAGGGEAASVTPQPLRRNDVLELEHAERFGDAMTVVYKWGADDPRRWPASGSLIVSGRDGPADVVVWVEAALTSCGNTRSFKSVPTVFPILATGLSCVHVIVAP